MKTVWDKVKNHQINKAKNQVFKAKLNNKKMKN